MVLFRRLQFVLILSHCVLISCASLSIDPSSNFSYSMDPCPIYLSYPIEINSPTDILLPWSSLAEVNLTGQIANSNALDLSERTNIIALFDFTWRSVTVADELIRLTQYDVRAAILTTSVGTRPYVSRPQIDSFLNIY